MTKELIDYHKTKMCLAGAEGRTEDYKFHKAAIELFEKLSLPSDIDEAANNYGIDIRLGYPRVMDETDKYIYNAFKAGAEWMAGQFEKVVGKPIGWYLTSEGKEYCNGIDTDECLEVQDFYIRKK